MYSGKPITSEKVMDYVLGKIAPRVKLLEEFQKHNEQMKELLGKGYARGTLQRFTITKNHLASFIKFKFKKDDIEFADLNLEFVKDFEFGSVASVRVKYKNLSNLKVSPPIYRMI
ncbi:phage integrase SAM-like domain-containing protein [Flavobacterium sp. JLP]|uniref:phage integrase SAM-like domain-containing protein n=1 Tax=Flavobacterium sp. JLP TaxID=2783793 RepID=UPI001E30A4C7|nr:phage integrase SAM-like domain-containing protein [Flavobacterium sp. JLP]